MRDITIAITAASYSGNKGAAAMLQSSICQLRKVYGNRLHIYLMSVYPKEDALQCPHDFVKIIPAQPQRLLFLAFPCAVLYRIFRWCLPIKRLLLKNGVLKAYAGADLVIDEAGISFSDSRGFIMNTYSFVCAAVPLLMGVPLVKYSQALGPFHKAYNRFLAGCVLPRAALVIARGRSSYRNLRALGLKDNIKLCADGAFTMRFDQAAPQRAQRACAVPPDSDLVGLSISSVVAKRCKKAGIDYCGILVRFVIGLAGRGYRVYMFANAARIHSRKLHNNDLPIGDAVYRAYRRLAPAGLADRLIWEHREMDAEEISACIGQCRLLVSSRFHAMVFALDRKVPVMLVGWGHKYQEVMEPFGLGAYTADFSDLDIRSLEECFHELERDQEEIRRKIAHRLPAVRESSRQNVKSIVQILEHLPQRKDFGQDGKHMVRVLKRLPQRKDFGQDGKRMVRVLKCLPQRKDFGQDVKTAAQVLDRLSKKGQRHMDSREAGRNRPDKGRPDRNSRAYGNHVIDFRQPDTYIGPHLSCCMGYAADSRIRANAASGGMVTALLLSLLKNNEIDGAWVVKTAFTNTGDLAYQTYIAKNEQQVREASSSVYMKIPMLSHINELRQFDGRLAVVLTPCMMRAFGHILEKDDALRRKIVLKIGLFCSGAHDRLATEYALDHYRIPRIGARRLYYRRGHWHGTSSVLYEDGKQIDFPYTKSVCAYKNAYFFIEESCLGCRDQYAAASDISFGDVWLSEVKKEAVKYTGCVIRTTKAQAMLKRAQAQQDIMIRAMSDTQMLRSQMRALTFKYRDRRWNHRLAGYLAVKNRQFSKEHPDLLKRVPVKLIYYYMCMMRLLLSW